MEDQKSQVVFEDDNKEELDQVVDRMVDKRLGEVEIYELSIPEDGKTLCSKVIEKEVDEGDLGHKDARFESKPDQVTSSISENINIPHTTSALEKLRGKIVPVEYHACQESIPRVHNPKEAMALLVDAQRNLEECQEALLSIEDYLSELSDERMIS